MPLLCRDPLVSLSAKNIQHITQRGKNAALKHVENSGTATTDQRNTLLVLSDGLLLITTLDVPEHHAGQIVTGLRKDLLCILEVGDVCTLSTVIKLHIGDDIQCGRHLSLGDLVFNSGPKDQFEDLLDVGVSHLVVIVAVTDFSRMVSPLISTS